MMFVLKPEASQENIEELKKHFSEKELEEGYRLSCKAYPESNCTVQLDKADENEFDVVLGHNGVKKKKEEKEEEEEDDKERN